jgi:hypothetical protein
MAMEVRMRLFSLSGHMLMRVVHAVFMHMIVLDFFMEVDMGMTCPK